MNKPFINGSIKFNSIEHDHYNVTENSIFGSKKFQKYMVILMFCIKITIYI